MYIVPWKHFLRFSSNYEASPIFKGLLYSFHKQCGGRNSDQLQLIFSMELLSSFKHVK